jgi:hypothetical protein
MSIPEDIPYDAYFLARFTGWGWASWADRMKRIDWVLSDYDDFIKTPSLVNAFASGGADLIEMLKTQREEGAYTWDILAAYASFKHGQLSLAPRFSYATNIGTSGEGTHVDSTPKYHPSHAIELSSALDSPRLPTHVATDERILKSFRKALGTLSPPFARRFAHWMKRLFNGR